MAKKPSETKRHIFQGMWALMTNSYLIGFAQGKIYQGNLKSICMPGLNCYSCPGAIVSCPIGALQAVTGSREFNVSFYMIGFIMMIGIIMGRFVCGWLCPFGWIQDLLHKIPFPKKMRTFCFDKVLRYLKYVILVVFVILMPLFLVDVLGQGAPYFCKLICPVGMLEGGIPLAIANEGIREAIGFLYAWKGVLLLITIVASIIIYRPFCKYICPLGACYALLNRFSFYRYEVDEEKCIHCNACQKSCKMGVDPVQNANNAECIRCNACKSVCPTGAITSGFIIKAKEKNVIQESNQES